MTPKLVTGHHGNRAEQMVVLFLLALLLAWPTVGLSIVAYVIFALFRSYLNAKSRVHDANVRHAERTLGGGETRLPSWVGDREKRRIFVDGIQKSAIAKGVSQGFLHRTLADNTTLQVLMLFAGALEEEGSSFIEQQVAVSDKLAEMWSVSPDLDLD